MTEFSVFFCNKSCHVALKISCLVASCRTLIKGRFIQRESVCHFFQWCLWSFLHFPCRHVPPHFDCNWSALSNVVLREAYKVLRGDKFSKKRKKFDSHSVVYSLLPFPPAGTTEFFVRFASCKICLKNFCLLKLPDWPQRKKFNFFSASPAGWRQLAVNFIRTNSLRRIRLTTLSGLLPSRGVSALNFFP